MKRKYFLLIVFLYLFISILFSSCGNDNKESGLINDTVNTEINKTSKKYDTAVVSNENKNADNDKTFDSISNVKLKVPKDSSYLQPEKKDNIKVIAYYFHPTARCPTCINIENYAKEVIDTKFSKEKDKGIITFREINIEDSINEHYINDYELTSSSLILVMYENKRQVKWKNLEKVWKFAGNKEEYFAYAKIEISQFLKEKGSENLKNKTDISQ